MRVGDVLAALHPEFPALSASKLRFLDAEGVVCPSRSGAGYRHYSPADVERLRLVLRMQRDQYAPLTAIAERLAALDAGERTEAVSPRVVADAASAWLSARELAAFAGVSEATVATLEQAGVLAAERPGRYARAAVSLVHAAGEYLAHGADPRELRALDRAAQREVDAATAATGTDRARGDGERADEQTRARAEAAATYFTEAVRRASRGGGDRA